MPGVPVVARGGNHLDPGDTRVVHAFGEPDLGQRLPQVLDLRLVAGDLTHAVEIEKVGVLAALEIEPHHRVLGDFEILVAVVGAQKPDVAVVIHLLHAHRAHCMGFPGGDGGAEEAAAALLDQLMDTLDRIGTAEVLVRWLGLVSGAKLGAVNQLVASMALTRRARSIGSNGFWRKVRPG